MSVLLLTMGPRLGIAMLPGYPRTREPAAVSFKAVGAVGEVSWRLVSSTLPPEWTSALSVDGEGIASLSTPMAEVPGDFEVTVRAVDTLRMPVVRTFRVSVLAAANWAWATTVPYPIASPAEPLTVAAALVSAEIRSLLIETTTVEPLTVTATLVSAEIRNPIAYASAGEKLAVTATLVSAEIRDPTVHAATSEHLSLTATLTSAEIKVVLVTTHTTEAMAVTATLVSSEIKIP